MSNISWQEYFMGVAILSAKRSKDPNTQVGACIVNKNKRIVGVGYNGMPYGCEDKDFPWVVNDDELESKYMYVVHAEVNAILNSSTSLEGCTIYAGLFPCNECCKAIIQSGIKEIIYLSDKYKETNSVKAGKRMLDAAKIVYKPLETNISELLIEFTPDRIL
ncbi:MAG: dCMP deaminase family protein [Clostridiales bacterium]|nr:dCMP deaminase family protein [Clostridiales bacterium]